MRDQQESAIKEWSRRGDASPFIEMNAYLRKGQRGRFSGTGNPREIFVASFHKQPETHFVMLPSRQDFELGGKTLRDVRAGITVGVGTNEGVLNHDTKVVLNGRGGRRGAFGWRKTG